MNERGLGEFGRLGRFFAPLTGPGGLGLKDDAALVDCTPGHRLVVTVDALVEGVHYLSDDPAALIARRLLRVNLSDLAAMGARPLHYLLATALPATLGDDWVARFAEGLAEDQNRFGVQLLGGGARPGDGIWVSGTIGDAFLGLEVLRGAYPSLAPADRAALAARFQLPEP